ncbi:hypothetical protein [Sphaerisporangium corydalis]|uniref:Ammonium transporter AmtB-like domain-containing protein n=1 Tax=Sphaerisporangium corydalis TaxID=1441875 RepID=A0ABV9EPM6_9ACTN|nr:hypothetical protein [Sphaerisporangium corydalis]
MARSPRNGLAPATAVLAGVFLSLAGFVWDVQWHTDVGPDTFFTAPHLLLYAGSAIAGLASLAVVLATTAGRRRGHPIDPTVGGRVVGVFGGAIAAPVGYLISGSGAASFLLYGLWDQWWHGLYGFDAMLASPPHVGLFLSITVTMVGAVMVFAAARRHRWGVVGTVAGTAFLVAFGVLTVAGLEALPLGAVDGVTVGVTFTCVVLVTMGGHVLDRRGGAIAVIALVAAMQAAFWWFAPWAARVYADAIGQPLREDTEGVPVIPAMIPMVLIVVGVLVEVLRRRPAWPTGAIGGAVIAASVPLQEAWVYQGGPPQVSDVLIVAAAGTVAGALAGSLGARFGEMLRVLAPKETSHA